MAFLFWLFAKARKPFFFVCYGGLYVISKTERDLSERIEKVILYYLAKYYILLGHFLYITWGSIIIMNSARIPLPLTTFFNIIRAGL